MLKLAKDFVTVCAFTGAYQGFALFLAIPVPAANGYQMAVRKLAVGAVGAALGATAAILALALLTLVGTLIVAVISLLFWASMIVVVPLAAGGYGGYLLLGKLRTTPGIATTPATSATAQA